MKISTFGSLLLCVSILIADDPLDGWNLLSDVRKINYWRNWTPYVDAYIFYHGLSHDTNSTCLTSVLKMIPFKLNLHKFVRKQVILKWIEDEFLKNPYIRNITSLVYLVQVLHPVKCKAREKIITFTWNLYLNKKIKTKLIFSQFKIFSNQLSMCQYNVTISLKPEGHSVSFCGIYNNYTYYSPRNIIHMFLHYGPVKSFSLLVIFDIISANVITTTEINENVTAATLIKRTCTNVQMLNLKVITFHIVTEKFKKISITIGAKLTVYFIDGPGFMSKRFKFNKVNGTFKSSTFQCIMQVKAQESFPLTVLIGEFTDKIGQDIKVDTNKTIVKEYSCDLNVCIHKIILNSPENTYINLTLTQFLFTGEDIRGCQYGGVSFYNIYGSLYNQIKSVCSTHNTDSKNLQTIYSDQRRLLMVFFSYKEYSSLKFVTEISHTMCLPIRHNICSPNFAEEQQREAVPLFSVIKPKMSEQIFEINMKNLSCAIFQIYRGILDCSKQHPEEVSFCYMHLFIKKLEGFIRHHQWYHYKINGYFSDLLEKYSCWESWIIIRGENFEHDKKKDINMSTWKDGNEISLNYSQYNYVYNTSQVCTVVCPVLNIFRNLNEVKALKYSLNFYTLIPTTDKSLRFRFKLSSQADWIDLVFKPFQSESNSKENTQFITNSPVPLINQYSDQILLLRVDPETFCNESIHLVVDVRMKVSICLNERSLVSKINFKKMPW